MGTKFPTVTKKAFIKFLEGYGYVQAKRRGKGSHIILAKDNCKPITIKNAKELSIGVVLTSLRDADISRKELIDHLNPNKAVRKFRP